MAFDLASGKRKRRPQMNVTPLVDVVLVLLIIFMVVTPMMTRRFWVNVPVKEENTAPPPPAGAAVPLVLRLDAKGNLTLNQEELALDGLSHRLERVFAARSDRVLFFDADDKAPYGRAVAALDLARAGGALTIAVLTRPTNPVP